MQAQGDNILVMQLTEPASYFLHLLSYPTFFALPHHVLEAHGEAWTEATHLVTCGPFRLETRQPGVSTMLVRNPDFCGLFRGNVAHVEVVHPTDRSSLPAMYAAGELDTLDLDGPEQVAWARQDYAGEYYHKPFYGTQYLAFQLDRPPFDDARVRQAFAHAINRNELSVIQAGLHQPGTGGFVPPGIPGHSPGIELAYDPGLARQLLEQAGYPAGHGFPRVQFGFPEWYAERCQELAMQWQQVLDVTVDLQPVDRNAAYFGSFERRFPVRFYGWAASFLDPDYFLRDGVTILLPGLDSPTYNRLIRAAVNSSDQGERLDLYRQADRILVTQGLMVPIFYLWRHFLSKPWLRRVQGGMGPSLRDTIIDAH